VESNKRELEKDGPPNEKVFLFLLFLNIFSWCCGEERGGLFDLQSLVVLFFNRRPPSFLSFFFLFFDFPFNCLGYLLKHPKRIEGSVILLVGVGCLWLLIASLSRLLRGGGGL
jgi:hypothetical protein